MANNDICGLCLHFSDEGRCRIATASHRETVGYFRDACGLFTDKSEEDPEPMEKKPTKIKPAEPAEKVCKVCGKTKPIDEFMRNRWGYTDTCIDCVNAKRGPKVKKTPAKKSSGPVQEYKLKGISKSMEAAINKPSEVENIALKQMEADLRKIAKDETISHLITTRVEEAKKNAFAQALRVATDQELADELGRRGWKGSLHKDLELAEK